jgi:hypothetical protein
MVIAAECQSEYLDRSDAIPKTAFVHIPRTGGTTLVRLLEDEYANHPAYSFYGSSTDIVATDAIEKFKHLSSNEKNSYFLLSGHFSYGFDSDLKGFRYLTFLREPVERLISYYFYILRERRHYLHPYVMQRRMKLESFLLSDVSLELDNYQVRAISGAKFENARDRVTEAHLDSASHNLSYRFFGFGLLDRFDESLRRLSSALSWTQTEYSIRNAGDYKGKFSLSRDIADEVASRNKYDIQLYRRAVRLFEDGKSINTT